MTPEARQQERLERIFCELIDMVELPRPGLTDTPRRAARAFIAKTIGYVRDPNDFVRVFEPEVKGVKGMILVRDIEVESMCEHHLERVWGYAHIAYVPGVVDGLVLGLSKFARIVDAFARRLQIQERLTAQVADFLDGTLNPQGVGVVIEARHTCMETRGVNMRGQVTVTSELRGCFFDDAMTRSEFLNLARTSRPF